MRFGILGTTDVRLADGAPVPVGGPRTRALLALLLLEPGRVVPAYRLIDGLYAEDLPGDAVHALQSQVSRLRRRLGGLLESHPAGYRLAIAPDLVDAHRFERLAAEGHRAAAAGDHAGAHDLLHEALGLWRGPALADVSAAPFAAAQAARLEDLRTAAAEDRAEVLLARGGYRDAVPDLRRLCAAHPLRERARGLLMRALHGDGRQAEALGVFEEGRRVLAEELGADPSPDLVAVHRTILRPGPVAGAPAAPPAQLTSFVGRDEDVRRVRELLARQRLVTLTGPGGVGKTRLAVEVSAPADDEVRYADLAPFSEPAEVPDAVLGALGLRENALLPGGRAADPVDRLVTALDGRRVLLVVDNCEHVIDAAARLVHRLLAACPVLCVLATSREPLGITGENLYRVPPLGLPPEGASAAEVPRYPAVRLFADRAAAVRGDLRPADDATAVQRICTALDGLPLAIELAAARLGTLPLTGIADRLDDRFRLLSRGSRTALPRHRTLAAVVRWSWDLLSEEERTLARRLAVFTGGFGVDAARRVCGFAPEEHDDLLAGLVDKSLVYADGDRYRMLETIHAFCAERLDEAGEREEFGSAHTAYFSDLACAADPRLRRGEQVEWLASMTAELGNLRAALRRSVRGDPASALRLVAALSWFWWLRGRTEGARPAAELLEVLEGTPPPGLEEEYVLCVLAASLGGTLDRDAAAHLDRARSILYGLARPARWPALLMLWAVHSGPPAAGDQGALAPLVGTATWPVALHRLGEGIRLRFRGDADGAERELGAALAGFRAVGDRWGTACALNALAEPVDGAAARDLVEEALRHVVELGALEDMADLLVRRAAGLVREGDHDAAHADYELAGEHARRAGSREQLAAAWAGLGEVARLRGDLAGARAHYRAALAEVPGGWFLADWTRASVLAGLGRVAEAESDPAEARARYREALALAAAHHDRGRSAEAITGLAGAALLDGDGERAALLLGAAGALRGDAAERSPDIARVAGRVRALIGDEAYRSAARRGASTVSAR